MNTSSNAAARVVNGTKIYGEGETEVKALDEVNVEFQAGEFTAIMGPSGSGKSTLMHCVAGLDILTTGQSFINDVSLNELSDKDLTLLRRDKIGFVFQDPQTSLNPLFKIKDQLIETIQTHLNLGYQDALKKSIQLLKEVGIDNAEKRIEDYPHQFSGGMRQRVVIALAISCEPDLIIADEPTTALDVKIGRAHV